MEDVSVVVAIANGEDWQVTREDTELGIDRGTETAFLYDPFAHWCGRVQVAIS